MKSTAIDSAHRPSNAHSWRVGSSAAHGITLLRVSLGVMWIAHALLKPIVFTLPGTAQFFDSVGIPGWMAYPVFAVELLGGIALLLGIYARQASLLLVPVMLVATWVHIPNGWLHTSAGGGWEYPAFLVSASLVLWLAGDGSFTLRTSSRFTPDR
ncbi:MAG TPA: DoxX family protein [Noviherbaspirillum sp.]|nr:DoxX family protein [Noviherbaspirillum sp.]